MTPHDLLDQLRIQGFKVQRQADSLLVAPRAALTPELRSLLSEMRPVLLDLLYREEYDPRCDLEDDTAAWRQLLALASADASDPDGLFGALRGLRSLGVRLERLTITWRLVRGDLSEPDYTAWRDQYLMPHRDTLTRLLRELAQRAEAA